MKIAEIVDGETQMVNALKQQAKQAQKRAREAALRVKLQKTQRALTDIRNKPTH